MQGLDGLDSSFVDRWRAVAQLKALQLPGKQVQAAPSRLAARSEGTRIHHCPNAQPSLRGLRHSVHLGWWHLRISLSNQGPFDFCQVSGSLLHPSLRLQSHGSTLALLRPAESGELTVSIPLAAVVQPTHLDVDVDTQLARVTIIRGGGDFSRRKSRRREGWWRRSVAMAAPSDHPRPHRWEGLVRERIADALGRKRTSDRAPPPTLSHSISLVIDVPPGSRTLLDLPRLLAMRLGLRSHRTASAAMQDNRRDSGEDQLRAGERLTLALLARSRWGASAGAAQVSR